MSRVLFSVWFTIQGIIQNTTCSIWFKIQRIIKKCPVYYSASGSRFRVFFKIRPAASGSGFSVLLKTCQSIIQRLVHDSGYFKNTSRYYSKMTSVLLSVWFRFMVFCSVLFRVLFKYPGYYSASSSRFRVLFKIRPAASGSGFSVLLKNVKGIIQHLVHDSGYYSKYDLHPLVQDSAYY